MHVHQAVQPQRASPNSQSHIPGHKLRQLLRLQRQHAENFSLEVHFVKPHNAYEQIEY